MVRRSAGRGRFAVALLTAVGCGPRLGTGDGDGGGGGGSSGADESTSGAADASASHGTTASPTTTAGESSTGEPACPGLSAPSFAVSTFLVSLAPVPYVAGDVNGDAWPDLVLDAGGDMRIWLGSANGWDLESGEPLQPEFVLVDGATRLRLARLFGDAPGDLAFLADGQLGVAQGDGAGEFSPAEFVDLSATITAFEGADLDGDGRAELIAAGDGTVVVVRDVGGENQVEEFAVDLLGVDELFVSSAQPPQVYVAGYTGQTAMFSAPLGESSPSWTGYPRMLVHYGDMAIVDDDAGVPTFFGVEGAPFVQATAVRAELAGDVVDNAVFVEATAVPFDPEIVYVGYPGGYDAVMLDEFFAVLVDFDCGVMVPLSDELYFGGSVQAIDMDLDGDLDLLASTGNGVALFSVE
jgi:hypothetical protein